MGIAFALLLHVTCLGDFIKHSLPSCSSCKSRLKPAGPPPPSTTPPQEAIESGSQTGSNATAERPCGASATTDVGRPPNLLRYWKPRLERGRDDGISRKQHASSKQATKNGLLSTALPTQPMLNNICAAAWRPRFSDSYRVVSWLLTKCQFWKWGIVVTYSSTLWKTNIFTMRQYCCQAVLSPQQLARQSRVTTTGQYENRKDGPALVKTNPQTMKASTQGRVLHTVANAVTDVARSCTCFKIRTHIMAGCHGNTRTRCVMFAGTEDKLRRGRIFFVYKQ